MDNINEHSKRADIGWGEIYYGVISDIINKNNFETFAEIGVAFGGHLEEILTNTKIVKSYAIDSYKLSTSTTDSFKKKDNTPFNQNDYDELYLFTKERLNKLGNRVTFIREDSQDSLKHIEDGSLDMIFIDAEHSYEGVKNDINNWIKKVKKGGIISGHDYDHPNFPGVKVAIEEAVEYFNLTINIERGYVWWSIID
jgi:hypothetical protein